jgi:hypothetical protein
MRPATRTGTKSIRPFLDTDRSHLVAVSLRRTRSESDLGRKRDQTLHGSTKTPRIGSMCGDDCGARRPVPSVGRLGRWRELKTERRAFTRRAPLE